MQSLDTLVESLRRSGAIRSGRVEEAFRAVDPSPLLPEKFKAFVGANAPVPYDERLTVGICPSPEALAAMLEVLELEPGVRAAVIGGGPYPAALAASLVGDARVGLVERDPVGRERSASVLRDRTNVGVAESLEGTWDRLWFPVADPSSGIAESALSDMGFAVAPRATRDGPALIKRIRSGGEVLELFVQRLAEQGSARGFDVGRSLALDDLMVRAWQGRTDGPHDRHFAESVDETFAGGPLDPTDTSEDIAKVTARKAFQVAYVLQSAGELRRAADMYERSIDVAPSAEAHTFLGWTYSFEGRHDDAIRACRAAIATDPTFGNPYNDIGAYLLELGRSEEAIPWLEKALGAPRYCCPFYAHTNLGRAYLLLGRQQAARRHFLEALKTKPDYEPAQEMLRRIDRASDYFA